MTINAQKPVVELGIEFVVELLLFLYPYGAEQMGLPHSFWLGLVCWVVGTVIALRMFWIFPLWATRLTRLEKGLIAGICIAILVCIFFKPVTTAYRKHNLEANQQPSAQESTPPSSSGGLPPTPTPKAMKTAPPKEAPKTHAPTPTSPSQTVVGENGAAVGSITAGPCSNIQVGGSGNTSAVNCAPPSRIPSDKQMEDFKAILEKANKITIRIFPAGSTDDVPPIRRKLCDALHQIHWPFATAKDVDSGGYDAFSVEGIECYSVTWDSPSPKSFAEAMDAAGLRCKKIAGEPPFGGATGVIMGGPGGITVLIGRQPR